MNKKRDTYDIMLLSYCNGKNSILDISKKIGLSYQTTFTRIKDLEKNKDIIINSPELIGDKSLININPEKEKEIKKLIDSYNLNYKLFQEHLKDTVLEKEIKHFLNYLKKNRHTSYSQYLDLRKAYKEISLITPTLESLGIIKERLEITKIGSKILKDLETPKTEGI